MIARRSSKSHHINVPIIFYVMSIKQGIADNLLLFFILINT